MVTPGAKAPTASASEKTGLSSFIPTSHFGSPNFGFGTASGALCWCFEFFPAASHPKGSVNYSLVCCTRLLSQKQTLQTPSTCVFKQSIRRIDVSEPNLAPALQKAPAPRGRRGSPSSPADLPPSVATRAPASVPLSLPSAPAPGLQRSGRACLCAPAVGPPGPASPRPAAPAGSAGGRGGPGSRPRLSGGALRRMPPAPRGQGRKRRPPLHQRGGQRRSGARRSGVARPGTGHRRHHHLPLSASPRGGGR